MSVIAVGNSHTGPQNASTVAFNKHQPGYQSTERGNRSDVMKIYICCNYSARAANNMTKFILMYSQEILRSVL